MGWNTAFQRTRDQTARALRVDLSSIDGSIAKELLREYGGVSRGIALSSFNRLKTYPKLFHVDLEDLIAICDAAIFEAWISYRDGDTSRETTPTNGFGGGFTSHVRRVIFWRLRDYVSELNHNAPDATTRCDAHNGGLSHELSLMPSPEEILYDGELRTWLQRALPRLTIRQRAIVAGISRGESQAKLARELGLDRREVHREYHRALDRLRQMAERAQLEGTNFGEGHV